MEKILLISNYPGGFGVLVFVCIFFFLKLLSLPKEPKKLQKYVEPEVVFFFFSFSNSCKIDPRFDRTLNLSHPRC